MDLREILIPAREVYSLRLVVSCRPSSRSGA